MLPIFLDEISVIWDDMGCSCFSILLSYLSLIFAKHSGDMFIHGFHFRVMFVVRGFDVNVNVVEEIFFYMSQFLFCLFKAFNRMDKSRLGIFSKSDLHNMDVQI